MPFSFKEVLLSSTLQAEMKTTERSKDSSSTFSSSTTSSFSSQSTYSEKDFHLDDDADFWSNPDVEADIAVCVSGQVARWQPFHLLDGLLRANPQYRYHFFFNIQASNRTTTTGQPHQTNHGNDSSSSSSSSSSDNNIVYNTDTANVFDSGYMTSLTHDETWLLLNGHLNSKYVRVASLVYIEPATVRQWQEYFQTTSLDRITQYKDAQATILNMYAHQPRCIAQVLQYERQFPFRRTRTNNNNKNSSNSSSNSNNNAQKSAEKEDKKEKEGGEGERDADQPTHFKFDYIVSTREDVYFFKPLNLSMVIDRLVHGQENVYLPTDPNTPLQEDISYLGKCDIPYKRCLSFWGLNMRFYILKRNPAVRFFGNRLSFYQFLVDINKTVENPERFELAMANALELTPCPFPVDDYPITAARYFAQGQFCFIQMEVHQCVPMYAHKMVQEHMCADFRRKMYLQYIYTEAKLRLKHNFTLGFTQLGHGLTVNLTEQFKSLKGPDLRRHVEIVHPFHSTNASFNRDVVQKIPKATAMYLARDIPFIRRTWTPLYP